MSDSMTLYHSYRADGEIREPLHADDACHHLERSSGTARPIRVETPVARDVCGTCAGDVPTVESDSSADASDTADDTDADGTDEDEDD